MSSEQKPVKKFEDRSIGKVKLGKSLKTEAEYLYLQFDKDTQFKAGDKVYLNDIAANIEKQVTDGRISRDVADARLKKLSFMIYDVTLPANKA